MILYEDKINITLSNIQNIEDKVFPEILLFRGKLFSQYMNNCTKKKQNIKLSYNRMTCITVAVYYFITTC